MSANFQKTVEEVGGEATCAPGEERSSDREIFAKTEVSSVSVQIKMEGPGSETDTSIRSARSGDGGRKSRPSSRAGPLSSKVHPYTRSGSESGKGAIPKLAVVSVEKLDRTVKVHNPMVPTLPSLNNSATSLGATEADVDADEEDMSSVSLSSRLSSIAKKKRGRPPTTGDYVGLAEAKKAAVAAEKEELALRTLRARLDGEGGSTKTLDTLPREDDLREEAQEKPTADLGAIILEEADAVDRMATTSNNLKGTYVRSLRLAARKVRVMATELVERTSFTAEHPAVQEVKRLRNKVSSLEEETAALRRELEALRKEKSPAKTPPKKRQRRAAARALSSSSDEPMDGLQLLSREPSPPLRSSTPTVVREERSNLPPFNEEALLAKVGAMMEAKMGEVLKALAPRMPPPPPPPPKAAPRNVKLKGKPAASGKRGGGSLRGRPRGRRSLQLLPPVMRHLRPRSKPGPR